MLLAEIAKCFSKEMKTNTLWAHLHRKVQPMVDSITEARARGDDPLAISLTEGLRDGKNSPSQNLF